MASDSSGNRSNKEAYFDLNVVPMEDSDSSNNEREFSDSNPPTLQLGSEGVDLVPVIITPSEEGVLLDVSGRKRKKTMSDGERWVVNNALLSRSVNVKLKRDTTKIVANLHSVPIQTVQRIWKRAKQTLNGSSINVSHRRKGKCGRMRVQVDLSRVLNIDLSERTTMRSLANALGIKVTTLFRLVKKGLLRRHSNAIKPYLKEENKRARLEFCLSMLEPNFLGSDPKFVGMYNMVHIDEKWFYLTKKRETYYLLPEEEAPLRTCQSKNFIKKVMFLVAMARPRFDDQGNETFDGKIGVFPFIDMQPAKRKSRNRAAGTLEMKPITSVKRETIKAYLVEKVIPKIQEVWPKEDAGKTIFIQQDNARTHVNQNDTDFQAAGSTNGIDIRLVYQPSNSPDLNILDLGFFSAIQSLQHKAHPKNVVELVNAVHKSFDEFSSVKINHVFLSLQLCMLEIMRHGGSNKYKIPHINKTGLQKEGLLPKQITCDQPARPRGIKRSLPVLTWISGDGIRRPEATSSRGRSLATAKRLPSAKERPPPLEPKWEGKEVGLAWEQKLGRNN